MNRQRISTFICIALLVMACFAVISASAQNVPATAREAAASPQFAGRLAQLKTTQHKVSTGRRAGACSPLPGRTAQDILPLDNILYSNGPINGTTDAWTINSGFVTADSFTVGGAANVTGLSFGVWVFPGDVIENVQVAITSQAFGGTIYSNQVVSLTQSNCSGNQYGFNVCTASGNFSGPNLSIGTYWVNLSNAVVDTGDPVYWDENSGPSSAEENSLGTIPSEAFTIFTGGSGNACIPEQQGNFKVIHDFSGGADGSNPDGVILSSGGTAYGAAGGGTAGSIFQMAQSGSGWQFRTLYEFLGGNNGGYPGGLIPGPNNSLYGTGSGTQICHGYSCGLIFSVSPGPAACLNHACSWLENVLYRFTGVTDAWAADNLVLDGAGNLYGVSYSGGAQQVGAVFELSPTIGGWVESILYSFTGGSDGGAPGALLVGNDGNLYGLAGSGGANGSGVVFQLTPSGNGWTETVLANLPYSLYSTGPHSLLQDSEGNLYGEWNYWYQEPLGSGETLGVIFTLTPSNGGWTYTELARGQHQEYTNDIFYNLVLDSAGNLWGTGGGAAGCLNPVLHGYIFELARTNNGWIYSTPEYWNNTDFNISGGVSVDAHGNLYGTTLDCGAHNDGTVWEFSTQ